MSKEENGPNGDSVPGISVLERSLAKRSNTDFLSKRIDSLLDHYYNHLEEAALAKVDKQLIQDGVVKEVAKVE